MRSVVPVEQHKEDGQKNKAPLRNAPPDALRVRPFHGIKNLRVPEEKICVIVAGGRRVLNGPRGLRGRTQKQNEYEKYDQDKPMIWFYLA
jgi:hypothetical protein